MEWINSRKRLDRLHRSRRLKQEKDMYESKPSDLPVSTISLNHFLCCDRTHEEIEEMKMLPGGERS